MTIGDLKAHFKTKDDLRRMIEKYGEDESARRIGWLHGASDQAVKAMFDMFLSGNYLDDKGVRGGDFFWGDL